MKRIALAFVMFTQLLFIGCGKDNTKEPESTTVTIGSQIWTKSNYTINGKELFTHNEAKAVIPPPDGFRLPTKNDWGKLFIFTGDKGGFRTRTVVSSANITETSMEGDFEIIKSLMATVKWDTFTGTNTTGFNAKPISGSFGVQFYVSDPVYGYAELASVGYYVGVFSKDPRPYFTGIPDAFPDKYAIRFVKDK